MHAQLQPISQGRNVVAFRPGLRGPDGHLTWRDRIALHEARDRLAAAGYRYATYKDETADGWTYDLVQLFRGAQAWSSWCMVRHGDVVRVWRCADGADVGQFGAMADALSAVLAAPGWARSRPRLD